VSNKIASATDVRNIVTLVARGEASLGIVYKTDVVTNQNIKIIAVFPDSTHPPIVYPVAITTASTNPEAIAYVDFLKSEAAKLAFEFQSFVVLQ
jgi:molybdate transport system substrate-binding protein